MESSVLTLRASCSKELKSSKNKDTQKHLQSHRKAITKRKVVYLPNQIGANQKHNFLLLLFVKEFKNMGKHLKYSEYKLSFFQL